jgi:hypothetical protein
VEGRLEPIGHWHVLAVVSEARASLRWRLPAFSFATAVLLSACSIIPWNNPAIAVTSTARDPIGADTSPELVGGVVEREVKITIPPGGLENAEDATLRINAYTGSPEPFSDITMAVGDPVNETVTIRKVGSPEWEWPFPIPSDCDDGCVITIPVTIEQVEEGPTPVFGWSADLGFAYESEASMPEAAHNLTGEIVPASK